MHIAQAQIVFEAELGNDFTNFEGWKLVNTSQVTEDNNKDFQLGSANEAGTAISPELPLSSAESGRLKVTFYMKVEDVSTQLKVTVIKSGIVSSSATFNNTTTGWY